MVKVVVLGSGAREHALAYAFDQSNQVEKVEIIPGNSCKYSLGSLINGDDVEDVRRYCKENKIDLVVIGPEKQICEGWEDELKADVRVFAPSKSASLLEASKTFAKEFMIKNGIPTARFHTVAARDDLAAFLQKLNDWKGYVIKEDGLCAGKGVTICKSVNSALETLNEIFSVKADSHVIVEEFLEGYEVSALCFTDGKDFKLLPFSQDHKAVGEGDTGPNTGGMGAIAPLLLPLDIEEKIEDIITKTINGMAKDGRTYKGVLYAGLMITSTGPKVLEYNCRFGDPETQVLLRLLESDLYDVCVACCDGCLDQISVKFSKKKAAAVVVASKGYPGSFKKDVPIQNLIQEDTSKGLVIYHAGIKKDSTGLKSCGGRVLTVSVVGDSFFDALRICYEFLETIQFENGFWRRDIGHHVIPRAVDYSDSGVDISEGNQLVDDIKGSCAATKIPGTDAIGGFGAILNLDEAGYRNPSLVIGMDGVGTKLEIASQANKLDGLGYDLVGMCVNDIICHGARPLAFLDYYVTGKLNRKDAVTVIKSIANACLESGCALVGGETAEMPGVYNKEQWDLAGCCIGAKEKSEATLPLIERMNEEDVLIGVESNGVHSNGFSLIRRILKQNGIVVTSPCPWKMDQTFADELLRPTKLYAKLLMDLIKGGLVKGVAHITGGGLVENVPRVLPKHLAAVIKSDAWEIPEIFKWIQSNGPVEPKEMFRTFNCGLGMVLVVPNEFKDIVIERIYAKNTNAWCIGSLRRRTEHAVVLEKQEAAFPNFSLNYLKRRRVNVAVLISGTGEIMYRVFQEIF
uniref:Phosphoribosylformylglycinamidine cyclo-ligase n=1 Tax=Bursaphelenchus xylophilus TaxID=6326 RepID=A0A1I7SM67_BURXY